MGWFGRGKGGVPSILGGVTPVQAAQRVVAEFRADPRHDPGVVVESIDVVGLRAGQLSGDAVPGVALQWSQHDRRFGLLMPIERLAQQAGGIEGAAFYLRVAVNEPHEPSGVGTRSWFTDLPSGPY